MEIKKQPPIVHTAYNPVVVNVTDTTNPAAIKTLSITTGFDTIPPMKRYPLNGNVLFEISSILKSLFTDDTDTSSVSDQIEIPHAQCLHYSLEVDNQNLVAETTTLMTGESSDRLKKFSPKWSIFKTAVTLTAYFGDDGQLYFKIKDPAPYLLNPYQVKVLCKITELTPPVEISGIFDRYYAGKSIMTGSDQKTAGANWTISKSGVTINTYFDALDNLCFEINDPTPYLLNGNQIEVLCGITTWINTTLTYSKIFDRYCEGESIMTGSDQKNVGATWVPGKTNVTSSLCFDANNNFILSISDNNIKNDPSTGQITSQAYSQVYDSPISRSITFNSFSNNHLSVLGNKITALRKGKLKISIGFFPGVSFDDKGDSYFDETGHKVLVTLEPVAYGSGSLTIESSIHGKTTQSLSITDGSSSVDYQLVDENDDAMVLEFDMSEGETLSFSYSISAKGNYKTEDEYYNEMHPDLSKGNLGSGLFKEPSSIYSFEFTDESGANFYVKIINVSNEIIYDSGRINQPLSPDGKYYISIDFNASFGNIPSQLTTIGIYEIDNNNNQSLVSSTAFYYKYDGNFIDVSKRKYDGRPFYAVANRTKFVVNTEKSLKYFGTTNKDIQFAISENNNGTNNTIADTSMYYVYDSTFVNSNPTYNGMPFYEKINRTEFIINTADTAQNSIPYFGTSSKTIDFSIAEFKDEAPMVIASTTAFYVYNPDFLSLNSREYKGMPFYYQNKTFAAINAVAQLAESSDLTPLRGTFLTRLDRLLLYPGYPRQVTCLGFRDGTYVNRADTLLNPDDETPVQETLFNVQLTPGNHYIALSNQYPHHYLQANSGEVITTNQRGEIITITRPATGYTEHRIAIENICLPPNPFYVRWINRQGGLDYWMFSFRQTIKEKVKITDTYYPVVYDQLTANAFSRTLGLDGTATITVGANGLTDNEYDAVSKVIYAPRVQYFDTDKSTWITLAIADSDVEKDTYASTQEIEITFQLPTPQVQF